MHLNPEEKNKHVSQFISDEKSFHQDNGFSGHKNENTSGKVVLSPKNQTVKGNIFAFLLSACWFYIIGVDRNVIKLYNKKFLFNFDRFGKYSSEAE